MLLKKEYGQTNTFMRIMLMAKITKDMLMRDSFHKRSGVLVSLENVWVNRYVQMYSLVTKQPILSQNETRSKRKRPTFLVTLGDFLYKVWLAQKGFSKLVFGDNYRSSHPEVFFRKFVFRNSAKFTGKHLFQRNFIRKEILIFLWILQNF